MQVSFTRQNDATSWLMGVVAETAVSPNYSTSVILPSP